MPRGSSGQISGLRVDGASRRQLHLSEQLEAVTARDRESDAAAGAREVARGDVLDGKPSIGDPRSENIEIAFGGDLEAGKIHSRRIGRTQNDAVTVEFVP